MLRAKFAGLAMTIGVIGAAAVMPASAQDAWTQNDLPNLPSDFVNRETLIDGDTIRFCVYGASATGEFDRQVAQLLAGSLLLEVKIHEVEPPIAIEGLDIIPITLDELFMLLSNDCDAFMGLEMAPEVYPIWLSLTRAYFSSPYVAVVREGEYANFEDLPPSTRVATQTLTTGDTTFNMLRLEQPEATRLRRVPYPTTILELQRLREGKVDAAIVWLPWLEQTEADIEGLSVIPNGAVPLSQRNMSIAVRRRDEYLRVALDEAIGKLLEDGALAELYRQTYSPVE